MGYVHVLVGVEDRRVHEKSVGARDLVPLDWQHTRSQRVFARELQVQLAPDADVARASFDSRAFQAADHDALALPIPLTVGHGQIVVANNLPPQLHDPLVSILEPSPHVIPDEFDVLKFSGHAEAELIHGRARDEVVHDHVSIKDFIAQRDEVERLEQNRNV